MKNVKEKMTKIKNSSISGTRALENEIQSDISSRNKKLFKKLKKNKETKHVKTVLKKDYETNNSLEISNKNKSTKKHLANMNELTVKSDILMRSPKTTNKIKLLSADNAVITSESESETHTDLSQGQSAINHSDLVLNEKTAKTRSGPEHSIFIGNLPNTAKKSTLKTLFKPFGKILTIRFRTIDGVILLKKNDRKNAKALNCYVRFEKKNEAEAACSMNGETIEGNRIRVSLHSQKQLGHHSSTVFVGNIHKNTSDNELYDFFSKVGDIEYVRQISGKYIAYVCFKKGISIAKALKLNQQLLNGRPLRIMKVNPEQQHMRKNKKGNIVPKNQFSSGNKSIKVEHQINNGELRKKPSKDFHGTVAKSTAHKKHKIKMSSSEKKKKHLAQKLMAVRVKKI
ncbi:RNA-binding protein 34-like [Malaya genurostris]|uniref:RNA-binding protein 34-like n=1 Tax=Malaya genurostris TaxID=325434 RepID=UPI0026F3C9DA|nr:RNA-binding protein 34-like [Malaya genurostris]XP_058467918.1 RNA-binding protein 34-like [Malaya genurostris]